MTDFEPVIGLEVHIQLASDSKIFCACSTDVFDAPANSNICPICAGLPGVLPVLNGRVVEMAMAMALALECRINPTSLFHRKNYFYPDLPKGYQITQHDEPLAEYGRLSVLLDGEVRHIGIRKLHMEEDAGKNVHTSDAWLVDFNRCGVPLIEIVSVPEIFSADMAVAYLQHMQQLARYLGISDADMQKGNLRCDANVSIRPVGSEELRPKAEIKNINSFRFVKRAIELEIERQKQIYAAGKTVEAITMGYDENADRLRKQRDKETEEEYRYFHEPDLPEVLVSEEWRQSVFESLPELPVPRARRFIEQYGLPPDVAGIITYEQAVADYFEDAATGYQGGPLEIANWIRNDILSLFSDYREILHVRERLSPAHLRELIELVDTNVINRNTGKTILPEIAPDRGPEQIVEEKGLQQVSDSGELEAICQKVLAANLDSAESYRSGKDGALNFLMGQVMRETKGKADPGVVRGLLKDLIDRT